MLTANEFYRQRFGCKVYKLSLDGGFTCPNRDGTRGTGGCRFCSGSGSGEFAATGQNIQAQLTEAKKWVEKKCKGGKYIAYFQSFTNTYGPLDRLENMYRAAMAPEEIVGIAVATRPDCLPPETVALLSELAKEKYVSVELGLQTVHEKTARAMNRGYDTRAYFDAVQRLHAAGLETVTHLILGLPGETEQDMVESARQVPRRAQRGSNSICFTSWRMPLWRRTTPGVHSGAWNWRNTGKSLWNASGSSRKAPLCTALPGTEPGGGWSRRCGPWIKSGC